MKKKISRKPIGIVLTISVLIALFVFVFVIFPPVIFNIKKQIWENEASNFEETINTELKIDGISSIIGGVHLSTDMVSYTSFSDISDFGLFSPNFVHIEIKAYPEDEMTDEQSMHCIYQIKDFCTDYVQQHSNSIFNTTKTFRLNIFVSNKERSLTILFSNYYNNKRFESKESEAEVLSDGYFSSLTSQHLLLSALKNYNDLTQIEVANFTDLDHNANFEMFENLRYLYIEELDYQKDKLLVERIQETLPEGCKFYVYDSTIHDVQILES